MNVAEYKARRAASVASAGRDVCPRCRKARPTCYCHRLRPFASPVPFVILQHHEEARNAIATARMAHLSLTNSRLIVDGAFPAGHPEVEALLADPARRNVMLYPAPDAQPLDARLAEDAATGRETTYWVLDAKWSQVPKMLRLSPCVRAMPTVAFEPDRESLFRVRRQPHRACLSTIEAIYVVIERYLRVRGLESTAHEALLDVFRHLVEQQLGYVGPGQTSRHRAAMAWRAERRRERAASEG